MTQSDDSVLSTSDKSPSVNRLREAWSGVAQAFVDVADTCRGDRNPMETVIALRKASLRLSEVANEHEIMYRGC